MHSNPPSEKQYETIRTRIETYCQVWRRLLTRTDLLQPRQRPVFSQRPTLTASAEAKRVNETHPTLVQYGRNL